MHVRQAFYWCLGAFVIFVVGCSSSQPDPVQAMRLARMYLVEEYVHSDRYEDLYPGDPVTVQDVLRQTKEYMLLGVVILKYDAEGRVTRSTHYFKRNSPIWDRLVDKVVVYNDAGEIAERVNQYKAPVYSWHTRILHDLLFFERIERIDSFKRDENGSTFAADMTVDEDLKLNLYFKQNEDKLVSSEFADEPNGNLSATNDYSYGYSPHRPYSTAKNREDLTRVDRLYDYGIYGVSGGKWGSADLLLYGRDSPFADGKVVGTADEETYLYLYEYEEGLCQIQPYNETEFFNLPQHCVELDSGFQPRAFPFSKNDLIGLADKG